MSCRQGNYDAGSSEEILNSRAAVLAPRPRREEEVVRDKLSFDVPALQRRTLRNQVMTRRRIKASGFLRMTIHTREAAILINRD